jgi:hypothetical protein
MQRDDTEASIRQRFLDLADTLNERQRRLWAAAEAKPLGFGGISLVARATPWTLPKKNVRPFASAANMN